MNIKFKKKYFKWFQLIHAIPKSWKKDIKSDQGKCRNLLFLNHNLIKNYQIYSTDKFKQMNFILFRHR